MRSLWRRISAREDGFSLLEVVMATAMLSIVMASMLTLFNGIQRTAARQVSRSETTDQIRIAMDRIAKDVRQATRIRVGSAADYLEMDTFVDGVQRRVTYDARSGGVLTRTLDAGTAIPILDRLQSTSLFVYSPDATDPSVIVITLVSKPQKFSQDMSDVTLTSEVKLRNR